MYFFIANSSVLPCICFIIALLSAKIMTDQLPKNALIKALPPAVQRFITHFFVTRAFVWLISIAFTLFVGVAVFGY
ncbi:hypothetical protein [Moraxella lacunata]|uniref:hypothetical protein n=1 Tax=Moraxella lacunata TaxID=477 RepID=UPI003EDF95C4